MKKFQHLFFILLFYSCSGTIEQKGKIIDIKQEDISNEDIQAHQFLDCMYSDSFFPEHMVDKCKNILLNLCLEIEKQKPKSLEKLYGLTHASTEKINLLQDEFFENNSEIETVARECLGRDFLFIAKSYGFDADAEELITNREW